MNSQKFGSHFEKSFVGLQDPSKDTWPGFSSPYNCKFNLTLVKYFIFFDSITLHDFSNKLTRRLIITTASDDEFSDISDDDSDFVPPEIQKLAQNIPLNSLPDISKRDYMAAYNAFKKLSAEKFKTRSFHEDIILVNFDHLKTEKSYAPPGLWVYYFMLKSTFNAFDNIDIGSCKELQLFLKKCMPRYIAKKSKVCIIININKKNLKIS